MVRNASVTQRLVSTATSTLDWIAWLVHRNGNGLPVNDGCIAWHALFASYFQCCGLAPHPVNTCCACLCTAACSGTLHHAAWQLV
jgi:hypothetical protein